MSTPSSSVAGLAADISTPLWELYSRLPGTQATQTSGWARTQAGGGTVELGIPPGALDVRAELLSLTGYEARLENSNTGVLGRGGIEHTIAAADAGDHVQIEVSGPRLNLIPRAGEGRQVFTDAAAAAGSVWAYTAGVRARWTEIDAPRTWASLAAGIAAAEGSESIEVATRVGDVANADERTSAALAAVVLSGGTPRVIEAGDVVGTGTLILSFAVVEGRLDADAAVTLPQGWAPVTGGPLANVSDAPRRVLWGAWRRTAARGAVSAPAWGVSGPANARMRTLLLAVDPALAVVWSDPERERTIAAGATVTVDVLGDAPIADVIAPVPGLDFGVLEGAVSGVTVTTTLPGITARIRITAGSAGATIADLRLRGVPVVEGADVVDVNSASVTAHGRAAVRLDVPRLTAAEAATLAAVVTRRRGQPTPGWEVVLDAARDAQTDAAARGVELRDVVRVALDGDFDRDGEIVSIQHEFAHPAAVLRTRLEMLALPAVTASTVPGAIDYSTLAVAAVAAVAGETTRALAADWDAPADNGGEVGLTYNLRYRTASGSYTTVTGITGTAHTITGLDVATAYVVEVAAVNSIGAGPWSTGRIATTAAAVAPARPAAPTLAPANAAIAATWAVPSDGGAPIIGFDLRYRADMGDWTEITGIATTARTITGLTNGTAYDVQVRASNAAGHASAWSPTATATPTGTTPPDTGNPVYLGDTGNPVHLGSA